MIISQVYILSKPIEIRNLKKINIKGGTIIDGFPSSGLANAIASECFIHSLKTELVAVLDSAEFPALSVIHNTVPNFPARIYANEDLKLAIFVSEMNVEQSLYYSISKVILQWAMENECRLIISAAGLSNEGSDDTMKIPDPAVYAAATTKRSIKRLEDVGIEHMSDGSVTGIPALLLNEGALIDLDIIVLLVRVVKDIPDFRAAAIVSEAITRLVPGASCDVNSLLKEAEVVEKNLKRIRIHQTNPDVHIYG
jgi:uncharacterized protein